MGTEKIYARDGDVEPVDQTKLSEAGKRPRVSKALSDI